MDGDERLLPERNAATQSSAISLDGNISMSFRIHLEIKLKSGKKDAIPANLEFFSGPKVLLGLKAIGLRNLQEQK